MIILIMVTITMSMQKNLYIIRFSHRPTTDSQPAPKHQLQNPELADFVKFLKKTELLDKRGSELTEERRRDSCLLANPH